MTIIIANKYTWYDFKDTIHRQKYYTAVSYIYIYITSYSTWKLHLLITYIAAIRTYYITSFDETLDQVYTEIRAMRNEPTRMFCKIWPYP